MQRNKYLWMYLAMLAIVISGTGILYAQETEKGQPELQFPTTKEEVISILGVKPPETLQRGRGALKASGGGKALFAPQDPPLRGLEGIGNDEQALQEAPKVGVLILFDYDSADIKEESKPLLKMYGEVLQKELADITLIVAGHTDNAGSEAYNLLLSQKRAEAVRQFLVSECQIAAQRLIVKPYGEDQPLTSNETAEGRAKNRRVEFIRIE